jgi:hypothetical protein
MRYILSLLLCYFLISTQTTNASTASIFEYNETAIEQQLSAASSAEIEFTNNQQASKSLVEKYQLNTLVNGENTANANTPDVGFLSFASGCCLGLPGVTLVSLHYYYKTNNSAVGRESMNIALIGFGIRLVATITVYYLLFVSASGIYGI